MNAFLARVWNLCAMTFPKNLEVSEIIPIFAPSIRGIRGKDDNLYGLQGRFEPHFYKPSLISELMALFVQAPKFGYAPNFQGFFISCPSPNSTSRCSCGRSRTCIQDGSGTGRFLLKNIWKFQK